MRPIEVRRERVVPVPVDVVWQVIEPAETLASWLPLADRCERVSGDGLGRRQRMYARWGSRAAEIDQEVIAYRPNATLTWKHLDEFWNGKPAPRISTHVTMTISVESVGPGTRVVLQSSNVPSNAVAAVLLRLVAARRIRRGFDRALENLARAGG